MGKKDPDWLEPTRQFCRDHKITIAAWGPNLLVVEAKSQERADEIASQLGQLGFQVVPDEGDAEAGLLSLSKDPSALPH